MWEDFPLHQWTYLSTSHTCRLCYRFCECNINRFFTTFVQSSWTATNRMVSRHPQVKQRRVQNHRIRNLRWSHHWKLLPNFEILYLRGIVTTTLADSGWSKYWIANLKGSSFTQSKDVLHCARFVFHDSTVTIKHCFFVGRVRRWSWVEHLFYFYAAYSRYGIFKFRSYVAFEFWDSSHHLPGAAGQIGKNLVSRFALVVHGYERTQIMKRETVSFLTQINCRRDRPRRVKI